MKQLGFFDLPDHMRRLSETGDRLEEMLRVIDFEAFRPTLEAALQYSDGLKGGRPPYDAVAMFKVLILAAQHNVSDARMEFLIRDRLSWLRFLGLELGRPTPDENTIRLFREKLTEAGAIRALFEEFDGQLRRAGYLAMGGQIVDSTLVSAPRQRNTEDEKAAINSEIRSQPVVRRGNLRARVTALYTVRFRSCFRACSTHPHGRLYGRLPGGKDRFGCDGQGQIAVLYPAFGAGLCARWP